MTRKIIDCREMPSEKQCDLTMIGEEEHLLPAAVDHAVNQHGHEKTSELESQIKGMLKDAPEGV